MIVNVRMLAFQPTEIVRPVEVPGHKYNAVADLGDSGNLLDLVFYYGQNEFCEDREITSKICSVSTGDVIELLPDASGSRNYLVMAVGFHRLTDEEYAKYRALDRMDRIFAAYAFAGMIS